MNLGGDNSQTVTGSFTRTDAPELTAEAEALPYMAGSGMVRDLRPTMSLGADQALDLQANLTGFAAGTTKSRNFDRPNDVDRDRGNRYSRKSKIMRCRRSLRALRLNRNIFNK